MAEPTPPEPDAAAVPVPAVAPLPPPALQQPNPGPTPEVVNAAQKLFAQRPDAAGTVGLALSIGGNPVVEKLTAEHLTKAMDLAQSKEDHEHELKLLNATNAHKQAGSDRWFEVFAVLLFVGLIVFTVLTFKGQPTIMTPTLTGIGGLFTGLLGGIGYGKFKQQEKKD